jgi:RNA polymerase sigma factor (sigma-70 family)
MPNEMTPKFVADNLGIIRKIVRTAASRTRLASDEFDDIVGDVVVKVLSKIGTYRPETYDPLKGEEKTYMLGYLGKIAHHCAIDTMKMRTRRRMKSLTPTDDARPLDEELPKSSTNKNGAILVDNSVELAEERAGLFQTALAKLSTKDKDLAMVYLDPDFSYESHALKTGRTANALRVEYHRLTEKIRMAMDLSEETKPTTDSNICACGREIERNPGRGRPRKKCATCKPSQSVPSQSAVLVHSANRIAAYD